MLKANNSTKLLDSSDDVDIKMSHRIVAVVVVRPHFDEVGMNGQKPTIGKLMSKNQPNAMPAGLPFPQM